MRIGLLQAVDDKSQIERRYPPLGLAYLASYLGKHAGIGDIFLTRDPHELIARKPDLVGISSVTHNFLRAVHSAQEVRKALGVPVVVGGPHISALPHTLPLCFDVGVLGEGEETFLDLCLHFQARGRLQPEALHDMPGIVFHGENAPVVTRSRPLIGQLDRIPFPRRDLFREPSDGLSLGDMHMLTSRGCPYKCVFCFSTRYWARVRYFSPRYVVDEIKDLAETWGAKSINIYDDLFIANKARLREIGDLLEQEGLTGKVRLSGVSVRADLFDDEVCHQLRRMGVQAVGFGAESGSPRVLSYLKKDTTTVDDNQKVVDLCRKHGFQLFASFIIGSPGEGEEELLETYDFISRNSSCFQAVDVYPLTPYPGTPIWNEALSKGLVTEDMDWDALSQDPQVFDPGRSVLLNERVSRTQSCLYFRLFQLLCQDIQSARNRSELNRAVEAQEAEIARLRGLVEGFKKGRVMRLLMGVQEAIQGMRLRREGRGRVSP